MSFFLSSLDSTLKLINEQEIDYFSRLTTQMPGKRCVFIANEKYIDNIDDSVAMIITTEKIADMLQKKDIMCGYCIAKEPRNTFFDLLIQFEKNKNPDKPTIIGTGCEISNSANISDIGVVLGNNVFIDDFVKIFPNTIIGDNTVIQSGVAIGAQLFNTYYHNGVYTQIPQKGMTIIGNNVLIGCNSVIAQAMYTYGKTLISDGTKIDANVSVSHNDIIGENCTICAGVSLGGYVEVGVRSELGLGVTVKNAVKIGKDAMVGMGSVVLFDVKDNESCFGNPARKMK